MWQTTLHLDLAGYCSGGLVGKVRSRHPGVHVRTGAAHPMETSAALLDALLPVEIIFTKNSHFDTF